MANVIVTARRISVILLASMGLLTLVSGMLLETMPRGPGSGYATALGLHKNTWTGIHVYAGFAAAGAAIVHVYTNYRGLLFHLGLIKPRRRTAKPVPQAGPAGGTRGGVGEARG
ncbi:MAG: DUF4405 domain-containing protein [Crenarchaeota archaeon]|nr:DUF4405 domain-containing protein [Thermoproteota archaeon]